MNRDGQYLVSLHALSFFADILCLFKITYWIMYSLCRLKPFEARKKKCWVRHNLNLSFSMLQIVGFPRYKCLFLLKPSTLEKICLCKDNHLPHRYSSLFGTIVGTYCDSSGNINDGQD